MFPDLPPTETAIVEMTNAFRKSGNLQEVKPNPALTAAARAFAEYLAMTRKFAHDADGREPAERAQAQGYRHCLVAENLAWNVSSRGFESRALASVVVEGWKESPSHRENLLLPVVTEIGVAVVRVPDKTPTFLSVQLLGRPESLKVTFSIQNQTSQAAYYSLGADSDRIQPRETVTHTDCIQRRLSVDSEDAAPMAFNPHDGDRFVIRTGPSRSIEVVNERE